MNFQIQEFIRDKVSEDLRERYFDFGDEVRREFDPDEPHPSRDLRRKLFNMPSPFNKRYEWIAFDGEKVIAHASFSYETEKSPSYEDNKHIVGGDITILKEYRRQGLGTKLLSLMLKKINEFPHLTKFYTNAHHESGKSYIKKLDGKFTLAGYDNRLYIKEIDWQMVDEWIESGREMAKKEGVELKMFVNTCPDDVIERYVEIYEETMNQQPLGDYEGRIGVSVESFRVMEERFAKQGVEWYTMYTQEPNGDVSGLTEMLALKGLDHKLMQNLTGVRDKYRGRGLGKWLKAELLKYMVEKYPKATYIQTGNATTNAPMLSINNRLGFKEFRVEETYSFEVADLTAKINQALIAE